MTTEDPMEPPYLGLLNAISIAERNAGVYLTAWADMTSDPELKQALTLVAARETTHGEVFRPRIERLDERVADESVDALTRDTLRWYVHEERDSRALLRAAYARVEGGESGNMKPPAA